MKRSLIALPLVALLAFGLAGCDNDSKSNQQTTVAAAPADTSTDGTAGSGFDSRPSDAPRINIQAVQDALSQVQQSDPQGWLQDFETRVNQIYEGDGVVSIDAHPDASNNLQIIGYVSKSGQQGFQPGDDEIFSIQQTGAVANNDAPYTMQYYTYGGGYGYYHGYYHNPFLTAWIVHSILSGPHWGGYYTSPARITVIHDYRSSYRLTPAYVQQRAATHTYVTNTYHGSPVTVRPAFTGTRPAVSGAPVHVPSAVTPPKSNGTSSIFNRSPAAAPAYRPYKPAGGSGLFSRSTFGSRSSGRRR